MKLGTNNKLLMTPTKSFPTLALTTSTYPLKTLLLVETTIELLVRITTQASNSGTSKLKIVNF